MNHSSYRFAAVGLCVAACATLPISSYAQSSNSIPTSSVTIYGIVDAGLEFLTHAGGTAANSQNVFRATSGNMSGSRFGFKGTEDLGGGNRAFFLLESGINVDTGGLLQGGREFGRLAYVGLASNQYGRLTLGRQGGIYLDWLSLYNPLGNAVYAIKMQDPAFSDRLDNSIRYDKKFGPVTVLAQYSLGYDNVTYGAQPPGDNLSARVIDAGVMYNAGDFSLALVYDQKNGAATAANAATTLKVGGFQGNQDRRAGIGASYKIANFDVMGGYRYFDSHAVHLSALSTAAVETSGLYWAGTTFHATTAESLSATVMYQNFYGTARDPLSAQIESDYRLSKRTDLYVNVGFVWNRHGADLGLNGFDTNVVAGKNQFGTQAGIRHLF